MSGLLANEMDLRHGHYEFATTSEKFAFAFFEFLDEVPGQREVKIRLLFS
jgi:hypothetical protein